MISAPIKSAVFAALLASGASSCNSSAGGVLQPSRNYALVVRAVVTDSGGSAVANAAVRATIFNIEAPSTSSVGKCSGTPNPPELRTTDARGVALTRFNTGGMPFLSCVALEVTPPQGSTLRGQVVSLDSVRLRLIENDIAPDTVTATVRL